MAKCDITKFGSGLLLQSKKFVDEISKIATSKAELEMAIAKNVENGGPINLTEQMQQSLAKVEAREDAFVVGAMLNDERLTMDALSYLSGKRHGRKKAENMVKAIDDVNEVGKVAEYAKLISGEANLDEMLQIAKNKLVTQEYYSTLIEKLGKLPASKAVVNSFMIYKALFSGEDTTFENAAKVLKDLDQGTTKIPTESISNSITSAKTLQDLEKIGISSFSEIGQNRELFNKFNDKLNTLAGGSRKKKSSAIYKSLSDAITDIKTGKITSSGSGFRDRALGLGYDTTKTSTNAAIKGFWDIISGKSKKETIFGKKRTNKDALEIAAILGPIEIIKLVDSSAKSTSDLAKVVAKALKSKTNKEQILSMITKGQVDELGAFIKDVTDKSLKTTNTGGQGLVNMVSDTAIDFSKKGIYFDGGVERFANASEEARRWNDRYNEKYNANQLATGESVDYVDNMKQLKSGLEGGDVKYVYIGDKSLENSSDLIDLANKSKYKVRNSDGKLKLDKDGKQVTESVVIVSSSRGKMNFTFGAEPTASLNSKGKGTGHTLTIRSSTAELKEELISKLYFMDSHIDDISDSHLAGQGNLQKAAKTTARPQSKKKGHIYHATNDIDSIISDGIINPEKSSNRTTAVSSGDEPRGVYFSENDNWTFRKDINGRLVFDKSKATKTDNLEEGELFRDTELTVDDAEYIILEPSFNTFEFTKKNVGKKTNQPWTQEIREAYNKAYREQLDELKAKADQIHRKTGKPVLVRKLDDASVNDLDSGNTFQDVYAAGNWNKKTLDGIKKSNPDKSLTTLGKDVTYEDGVYYWDETVNGKGVTMESSDVNNVPDKFFSPKNTKRNAKSVVKEFKDFKKSDKNARAVDAVDPKDVVEAASDGRLIVNEDGGRGLVTKDGDIKYVFKVGENKGVANGILEEAIKKGGIKMDNFDGPLTKMYEKKGFRVVSRLEYNPAFEPDGIPSSVSSQKPDVVFMIYDPTNKINIEVKSFAKDDYDGALQYRESFIGAIDEPVVATDGLREGRKEFGLAGDYFDDIDFEDAHREFSATGTKTLLVEALEFFRYIGYDIKDISLKQLDETSFRDAFYEWKYYGSNNNLSVEELIRGKLSATRNLKKKIGIDGGKNELNRAAVSFLFNRLKSEGFNVTGNGAKEMLMTYTQTGRVSDVFLQSQAKTSQKKIQDGAINIDSKVSQILDEAEEYLSISSDHVYSTPKKGAGVSVKSLDQSRTNQIIDDGKALVEGDSSALPIDSIEIKFEDLIDTYISKKKSMINDGASKRAIDELDEQFNHDVDTFDYIEIEGNIGKLYKDSDKPFLYGTKFSNIKAYTKEDLMLLDNAADAMKNFNRKRLADAKVKFQNGTGPDAIKNHGYRLGTDSYGNIVRETIDDVILRHQRASSGYGANQYRHTKGTLSKLSRNEKVTIMDNLIAKNKGDIQVGGYIKKILESTSVHIRAKKFFDRYQLIRTSEGYLPEAVLEDSISGLAQEQLLKTHKGIFEKVRGEIVKGNFGFDIDKNLGEIEEIIKEEVNKGLNELIAGGATTNIPMTDDMLKNVIYDEMMDRYNVYGHLRPIQKKEVAAVRSAYGMEDGITRNERDNYLGTSRSSAENDTLLVDDYSNVDGADKINKEYLERVDKKLQKHIERETGALFDITDAQKAYFEGMGLIGRELSKKNAGMSQIERARAASKSDMEIAASKFARGFFSDQPTGTGADKILQIASLLSSAFISPKAVFQNLGGFDYVGDAAARYYANDDLINMVKYTQDNVDELMTISDEDFAFRMSKRDTSDFNEEFLYSYVSAHRNLKKNLGATGRGKGPTMSSTVNDGMANQYLAIKDIQIPSSGVITGKDGRRFLQQAEAFWNSLEFGSILRGMDSPSVQRISGKPREKIDVPKQNIKTIGDDEIVTGGKLNSEEIAKDFNALFGSDYSVSEVSVLLQGYMGYTQKTAPFAMASQIGNWIKMMLPGFELVKATRQIIRPMVSGVRGLPGYLSQKAGFKKRFDGNEVNEAGRLRHLFGFGAEITDPENALRITSLRRELADAGESLGDYADRVASEADRFINNSRTQLDVDVYDNIINGEKLNYHNKMKNKTGDVIKRFINSKSNRDLNFLLQNGNNLYDYLFIGGIKDMAFYNAIKNNGFRNFDTVGDFTKFVMEQDPQMVDNLIAEVKATAGRIYADFSGADFSKANKVVNPYTGIAGGLTDAAFFVSDFSSYLTGWGRNKTLSIARLVNQSKNVLIKNGGIHTRVGRQEAAQFIANTPEYREYMWNLTNKVINTSRYLRIRDDKDGELKAEDIIRGLQATFQPYQALEIVTEARPLIAMMEQKAGMRVEDTVVDAFNNELLGNVGGSLINYSTLLELYNDIGRTDGSLEDVSNIIYKYMIDVSGGSLDRMIGNDSSYSTLTVPAGFDKAVLAGEDVTDPMQDILYAAYDKKSIHLSEEGDERAIYKFDKARQFLKKGERLFKSDKTTLTEDIGRVHKVNETIREEAIQSIRELQSDKSIVIGGIGGSRESKLSEKAIQEDFYKVALKNNMFYGDFDDFNKIVETHLSPEGLWDNEFNNATKWFLQSFEGEELQAFQLKIDDFDSIIRKYNADKEITQGDYETLLMTAHSADPSLAKAIQIEIAQKDTISNRSEIVRGYMTSEMTKHIETLDGGTTDVLNAMRGVAELYGMRDYKSGLTQSEKTMIRIDQTNAVSPILAELAPTVHQQRVTSAIGRRNFNPNAQEGKKFSINEKLGWEALKVDEDSGVIRHDYKFEGPITQMYDYMGALSEGDYVKAAATFSPLSTQMNVGTGKDGERTLVDELATMESVTYMLSAVENSNLTDEEKAAQKYMILKLNGKNFPSMSDIGDNEELAGALDMYNEQLFKAEEDIDILTWNGVVDELNSKYPEKDILGEVLKDLDGDDKFSAADGNISIGKVSAKTGGAKAKAVKLSQPEIKDFKKLLSKKLDNSRKKYKLSQPAKISEKILRGNTTKAGVTPNLYPPKLNAKTKTFYGFTASDLKERKDIKRAIKTKRSKAKITPPLI